MRDAAQSFCTWLFFEVRETRKPGCIMFVVRDWVPSFWMKRVMDRFQRLGGRMI